VCACSTIVLVYILLNREDHRWQWPSIIAPGTTGLYIYLYSIYYFNHISQMHGALQTSFYFGYMLITCVAMFMLCGTVGHLGTMLFIRTIYKNVKSD